jgi:nicotinate-nucleotide pyrophosphorylase (carboxylating)
MTASLLPPEKRGRAFFVARAEGVVAGRRCAEETFRQVDPVELAQKWSVDDSAEVGPGDVIAAVEGPLATILTAERTALNFLCHLSGVATLTRRYVRAARGEAVILDTRKTTPGLRALEKAAVRAGGGSNHRGSLSDGILVKDNHLAGMSFTDAIRRARLSWPYRSVEVECDTVEQVRDAVEAGADMVMLDNMTPPQVEACVGEIAGRCPVEVSGGIGLGDVGDYARAGANFISVGSLTHSAPAFDIGLDLEV